MGIQSANGMTKFNAKFKVFFKRSYSSPPRLSESLTRADGRRWCPEPGQSSLPEPPLEDVACQEWPSAEPRSEFSFPEERLKATAQ